MELTLKSFQKVLLGQFVLNILFSLGICVAVIATIFSGFEYIKGSIDLILESK